MSIISVKECVLLILFILISGAEGNPHHYTPKGGSSAAPPLAAHFACQSDPCLHGLCIDHSANSTYLCFCEEGYTGYQCQTDWNECWSEPCLHAGTCIDEIGRYRCLCRPGFTGDNCEVDIDECGSDPCLNGATCQDGPNGYRCRCLPGYEGAHCQIDVSVCRHHYQDERKGNSSFGNHPTCRNGARCVDGPGLDYHCLCPPGWTGRNCETDIDECCSDPCRNGGRCIDQVGTYYCACPFGFTGRNCESELERCDDELCSSRGMCWMIPVMDGSKKQKPVCYCQPDYYGKNCGKKYNECLLPSAAKCLNGGRCVDQVDGYSCSCPHQWSGPRCQYFSNVTNDRGSTSTARSTTTVSRKRTSSMRPISIEPPEITTEEDFTDTAAEMMTTTDSSILSQRELDTFSTTSIEDLIITRSDMSYPPSSSSKSVSTRSTRTSTALAMTTTEEFLYDTTTTDLPQSFFIESSSVSSRRPFTPPSSSRGTSASTRRPESSSTTTRTSTVSTSPSMLSSPTEMSTDFWMTEVETTEMTTDIPMTDPPRSFRPSSSIPPSSSTTIRPVTRNRTTSRRPVIISSSARPFSEEPNYYSSSRRPIWISSSTTTTPLIRRSTTQTPKSTESTPVTSSGCPTGYCLNGGTCLWIPDDGWMCRCPWRYDGRHCEQEKHIHYPQFHGNSYLSYALAQHPDSASHHHQQQLEVRLEFSTTAQIGLVSYIHSVDATTYMAVYVERSALKFRLSCGQQQMTLVETKYNVSDGAIHAIILRLVKAVERNTSATYCIGTVKLNNSYSMNGEQRLNDPHNFNWPTRVHLGGQPSGVTAPAEILFLPGMMGCTYQLQIDGKRLDMIKDALQGKGVDECPEKDPGGRCGYGLRHIRCLNGGSCSPDGRFCVCPMGWVGPTCEVRQCPCNPCQGTGSTCLMALNDQMVCLCAYGRTGPLCELEFNVTRPYFEGTTMGHASYLSLTLPPFDLRDHFEAKFQFVTDDSRQVALLLFVGRTSMSEEPEEINSSITDSNTNQTYFQQQQQYPNPNLKDFLAVSFIRGHVALTWDLGSGTRRIFTAQPVATTQTGGHSVHVGRRGRVAWLQVNNQPTVTGRSPGPMTILNTTSHFFLGGHPSFNHSILPSDLPLHSGFRGCIYDIVFRSRDVDSTAGAGNAHWIPHVVSGRSIGQCSIPSCRMRALPEHQIMGNSNSSREPFEDDNHLDNCR